MACAVPVQLLHVSVLIQTIWTLPKQCPHGPREFPRWNPEKERNMKQPCGLPFDAFGLSNDKIWNYTFEAKMKEAMGFAAPRAIKDAKIGQLQHPNLQVQSALESSGFEVWSGWQCHWKASNWQVLSFYFKESWIFWPSLSLDLSPNNLINNELEKFHAASFHCLLWYPFQWHSVAGRSSCRQCIARLNAPPCYSTLSPTSWVPFTAQGHWTNLPSELTYPSAAGTFESQTFQGSQHRVCMDMCQHTC